MDLSTIATIAPVIVSLFHPYPQFGWLLSHLQLGQRGLHAEASSQLEGCSSQSIFTEKSFEKLVHYILQSFETRRGDTARQPLLAGT